MDMRKFAGKAFVKVDDVREGPLAVRIAAVEPGSYDKPNLIFETCEALSLNATNSRILVRAYGPDSDDWLGKDIQLELGQIQFQGKLQDAVIVRPISPAILPAQREDGATAKPKPEPIDDDIPF